MRKLNLKKSSLNSLENLSKPQFYSKMMNISKMIKFLLMQIVHQLKEDLVDQAMIFSNFLTILSIILILKEEILLTLLQILIHQIESQARLAFKMNLGQILEESNVFLPKTINQVLSSVEVQEEIGIQNKHQILQSD